MKKLFSKNNFLFFLTLLLTSVCWLFTLFDTISSQYSLSKAIPAFQSHVATLSANPPDCL